VTAALLIAGGWQLANLLLILAAARLGVLRVTVARPARPKNSGGTT
jgi:hypothetical protein